MQEDHDLPNRFLFLPRFLDASSAFRTDAVDFLQSRRGFRDDREDLFAESINHFLCVDRTDASVAALVAEVERVYRAAATDLPALAAEGAGNADGEHMIRMFRQPVSAQ